MGLLTGLLFFLTEDSNVFDSIRSHLWWRSILFELWNLPVEGHG